MCSPADGIPIFSRFFSSPHGKGVNNSFGKEGICFLKRTTNNMITDTSLQMDVEMAAPSTPRAGIPNLPKISV
jgi:hypothetical protein